MLRPFIVLVSVASLLLAIDGHAALTEGAKTYAQRGGVIVHLGCGDGRETVELASGGKVLVQGLDVDPKVVSRARETIMQRGCYGRVSADTFDGSHLPYAENTINAIVGEASGRVTRQELLRVLAPGGIAFIGNEQIAKPWPSEIDAWTHYLHGPDNNAVANDTVIGPPQRLQWQAGPKWTRHHDHMSSLSALVSSGGRLFYILDEGATASILLPSHWALIARDAFNGKLLWKQPIDQWYNRFKGLKDGPADAPRRLVAVDDRVYATLSLHGTVTALDATTGEVVRRYADTQRAEEILYSDGVLFVLVGPGSLGDGARITRPVERRQILAIDAKSGQTLWRMTDVVAAMTMAVDGDHVYYFRFDKQQLIALNRASGKRLWASETLPTPARQNSYFASKLVVHDDVVLFASGEYSGMTKSGGGEVRSDTLTAINAENGTTMWTAEHSPSGYSSPEDLYVINDMVWFSAASNGRFEGKVTALDLKTGVVKEQFSEDKSEYWFHHRCYSGRATCNYMLTSRTGIEFIDLKTQQWDLNHWARGACLYGIMPANGLVYTPPSPCICYAETMLHSFNAYAPAGTSIHESEEMPSSARTIRGPAYGTTLSDKSQTSQGTSGDWPTYRGDAARSGRTATPVPADIKETWSADLGGKITPTVIADGRLFLAVVDRHTIQALDAASGKQIWRFVAGGRIDSPPTIEGGRALFGSADGYVYCVRADNGQLIWRFQAAARNRRIVSYEQFESVWPVHGSILVQDGVAHFVAGRSIFVDGGMRYYRVAVKSGTLISVTTLDDKNPETGHDVQELIKWLNMPVGRPDILSCDNGHVTMRSQVFDMAGKRIGLGPKTDGPQEGKLQQGDNPHLFCPTGFLDDTWFHRSYWVYGLTWGSGWNGYYVNGKYAPSGKIMSVGDDTVYVFGRKPTLYKWSTAMDYRLFAARKQWEDLPKSAAVATAKNKKRSKRDTSPGAVANPANYRWVEEIPILVRAMTLAGDKLFVAGPEDLLEETALRPKTGPLPDTVVQQEGALAGDNGALLWVLSTSDGAKQQEYKLAAPPVFDGMSAAGGRLYISGIDGAVRCFGR